MGVLAGSDKGGMARHGAGAVAGSAVVLLVAAGFAALAAASTGGGADGGPMRLRAVFPSSDGLEAGDAVVLAGIAVGRVVSVRLDRREFVSDVDLSVGRRVGIPVDSRFVIAGGGMGGGVLAIEPGHAAAKLADGAVVTATVPGVSLEQQVGNYIFGNGGVGD
jgi:phospholipid/cholesterol/gamma-HCH transport system substrate-binding protein